MLKRLYINNFALINEMDVSFPGNLTVITGETGAGKSIFIEALALSLGKRADLSELKNKNKKCIIEAEFSIEGLDLTTFFEENNIDQDAQIILRREINTDGKSRSFLNDSLVTLNVLKLLSEKLIDIHSQHQTLLLNQTNFQIEILDAFAGSIETHLYYKLEFKKLNEYKNTLNVLLENETQAKKDLDYYQFLFTELDEAEIKTDGYNILARESSLLENAETVKSTLINSVNIINGGELNIIKSISQAKQYMQSISKYGKNYVDFFERLNSVYIEINDLASDIEDSLLDVNSDDVKLNSINIKLDKLNRLFKKHNVSNEIELLEIKEKIEKKINQFESIEKEITDTKKKIEELSLSCIKIGNKLSKTRGASVDDIEKNVKNILFDLSMPHANFKIDLTQSKELTINGFDQIKFLFCANKGGALIDLQKVASGGELSRLMLCLKSLLATKKKLPTIIFDEIDTGVSGDVADKIGSILLKMGDSIQIIAITHLPQLASKGGHHLFVYKIDSDHKTMSHIKELNKAERITEIAKMLSTGNPTKSAIENARELLQ